MDNPLPSSVEVNNELTYLHSTSAILSRSVVKQEEYMVSSSRHK